MSKRTRLLAVTGIAALLIGGQVYADAPANANSNPPKSPSTSTTPDVKPEDIKKLSEAFGHFIGRNLNPPGVKFDLEEIVKGMRNGAAGKPAPMSDKEYEELMMKFQQVAYNQLSKDNLKAANDYLIENSKKDKVVVLEPGKLQYMILSEGNGPVVEPHSSPMINYTGKFLDGTVFGSSDEVGVPITIPLDQTIAGFSKGIVGMKEGEKRRLFVHPDLGYGTGGQLPPNALLIFDIELVKANSTDTTDADDEESSPLTVDADNEDGVIARHGYLNPDRYDDENKSKDDEDEDESEDAYGDTSGIRQISPQPHSPQYQQYQQEQQQQQLQQQNRPYQRR